LLPDITGKSNKRWRPCDGTGTTNNQHEKLITSRDSKVPVNTAKTKDEGGRERETGVGWGYSLE